MIAALYEKPRFGRNMENIAFLGAGSALGLFGVASLVLSAIFLIGGFAADLGTADYVFSVVGAAGRNMLLGLSVWAAFYQPHLADSFAWGALAIYVASVFIYIAGKHGNFHPSHVIPSFYITTIFMSAAALVLSVSSPHAV